MEFPMQLYYTPGLCSQAPHIALRETSLPFRLVEVDLARKTTLGGGDYTDLNPLGYIPLLELDDGRVLRETQVLLQYIADQAPGSGLAAPQGTIERYRLQEWLNFLASEIHKGFVPLIYGAKSDRFKDYIGLARPKLRKAFAWIDVQLATAPYLLGRTYSVADIYLWVLTNWSKASWIDSIFDADLDLTDFDNLREWHARIAERPAIVSALEAEGLRRQRAA
jgi:glutathione S-transferase